MEISEIQMNPFLPRPDRSLDYRDLRKYRTNQGASFFEIAMAYANLLWKQELPARALLAMDRALYADLKVTDEILSKWDIPYSALIWFLKNPQEGKFVGNPRVHYQHLADRVKGDREDIKRWRTWACWYLTCKADPMLTPDSSHAFTEPSLEDIIFGLKSFGITQDIEHFEKAIHYLENE